MYPPPYVYLAHAIISILLIGVLYKSIATKKKQ